LRFVSHFEQLEMQNGMGTW